MPAFLPGRLGCRMAKAGATAAPGAARGAACNRHPPGAAQCTAVPLASLAAGGRLVKNRKSVDLLAVPVPVGLPVRTRAVAAGAGRVFIHDTVFRSCPRSAASGNAEGGTRSGHARSRVYGRVRSPDCRRKGGERTRRKKVDPLPRRSQPGAGRGCEVRTRPAGAVFQFRPSVRRADTRGFAGQQCQR